MKANTARRSWSGRNTGPPSWAGEDKERKRTRKMAEERSRRDRWAHKCKARVVDPKRGEVIVPCASPFAAILCAAEVWKCDWIEIIHAEVWRYDE